MDKKDKDKKPVVLKYYDVKVEAMVPASMVFRILAASPEEALKMVKGKSPNSISYIIAKRKELKIFIYESGSSIIKFMKRVV